jgi:hypothetical protein
MMKNKVRVIAFIFQNKIACFLVLYSSHTMLMLSLMHCTYIDVSNIYMFHVGFITTRVCRNRKKARIGLFFYLWGFFTLASKSPPRVPLPFLVLPVYLGDAFYYFVCLEFVFAVGGS